jgi:UDP-glucose 4-epimerase
MFSDVDYFFGSYGDAEILKEIFTKYDIDIVLHFGGSISVSESVSNPDLYMKNNAVNTKVLVETMLEANIDKIIFSSTAAVYGNPEESENGVLSEKSN